MKTSLPIDFPDRFAAMPGADDPVDPSTHQTLSRQPVHTVYGGAHLFGTETFAKIQAVALRSIDLYASEARHLADALGIDIATANVVHSRILKKLAREPLEDFRIDFEDGYGIRSDTEEDEQAFAAAHVSGVACTAGALPPFFGIRIKGLGTATRGRAIRTLDIFLTAYVGEAGTDLPQNFVVTLPKVNSASEVALLAEILDALEAELGLDGSSINIEVMVETKGALIDANGRFALPDIVGAARGRCVAAHFGAYDLMSELGIVSSQQSLRHPACDLARNVMQLSLTGTRVRLSDGATSVMPIGPHRRDQLNALQLDENRAAVWAAWKLHYDNIRHALSCGFYQGWDLHPAQIVARFAAVYAFFLEGIDDAAARLKSFVEKGARANLVGTNFDDAATGQGLLNYFRRAIDCGAISQNEAESRLNLTAGELNQPTFEKIIQLRAARNL